MKKLFMILLFLLFSFFMTTDVGAQQIAENENYDNDIYNNELSQSLNLDEMYSELPYQVQEALAELGINDADTSVVSELDFSSFLNLFIGMIAQESFGVFSSLSVVIAVILIYSLTEGITDGLSSSTTKEILSVVCGLCVAGALVFPVLEVIESAVQAISISSDLMLAYIPVMSVVLISCGNSVTGSGYHAIMVMAAEGIAQLSSEVISPMLSVFLGINICSSVLPGINLRGFTALMEKIIKWMLSFSFTLFSGFLTLKTLISSSIDSVSTRAVRYTMSSFVPVVGSALSEAYRTVLGSVNILKNGIGVFVIISVAVVFFPVIARLLLWNISVGVCKSFSEMINLTVPVQMLSSVSTVLSVMLAVILCIMALFIVSTALIMTAGGVR